MKQKKRAQLAKGFESSQGLLSREAEPILPVHPGKLLVKAKNLANTRVFIRHIRTRKDILQNNWTYKESRRRGPFFERKESPLCLTLRIS